MDANGGMMLHPGPGPFAAGPGPFPARTCPSSAAVAAEKSMSATAVVPRNVRVLDRRVLRLIMDVSLGLLKMTINAADDPRSPCVVVKSDRRLLQLAGNPRTGNELAA